MRPSYNAFIETIKSNKIAFILIFIFNAIEVICENSIIIFTFYLLTFIQNGEINQSEISFPIGQKFFSFLGEAVMPININFILVIIIVIAILQGVCQYFGPVNSEVLGSWLREKINNDISRVILTGDYEKISKIKSGELLTISAECPEALRVQIVILTNSIIAFLYLFVYSRILLQLSFKEFFFSFIALILVCSVQFFTQKKVRYLASKTNNFKSVVSEALNEMILGIKYIKASGSTEFAKNKFARKTYSLKKQMINESIVFGITPPLSKFIGICTIAFIVYIFTKSSLSTNILLPTIGIFIVTLQRLIGKISELAQLNNAFNQNKGRMKLYDELIINYESPFLKEKEKTALIDNLKANLNESINSISCKGLSYKFRNENSWTLKNVNFDLKKGDLVGVVGRSGAGKTTFLNLICGLIKPTKGQFQINKVDIDNLYNKINKNISIVCQENYIISGTIYENIVWDQKPNKKKALDIISKIDNIGFIIGLREGIDTQIGKGGVSISGGQAQLISLARALYKDNDILILDEATNALDNISEKKVFQKIKEISKNKIIFLVSHNLENIKECSQIFLLDKNTLTKQKSFNEMLVNNREIIEWY